jgi:hypothetical protein
MTGKPFQSKLTPHFALITEMRRKRQSWQEIAFRWLRNRMTCVLEPKEACGGSRTNTLLLLSITAPEGFAEALEMSKNVPDNLEDFGTRAPSVSHRTE